MNAEALHREVASAQAQYIKLAKNLSAKRRAAAEALGKAVSAAMQQLAMPGGRPGVGR